MRGLGEFGNICKHRINVLDGETAAVLGADQAEVTRIREWLIGTDVESALNELRAAERGGGDLVAAKRKLARAMNS